MRRIGVCEERGSGVDKVVFQTELYPLPAPSFETPEGCTRAVLFAHKALGAMDRAAGRIKPYDPDQGKKYARYVPFWA